MEARAVGHEVTVATEDGAATISPVAVALAEADLPVLDISLRRPTLDDVFLDLTGGTSSSTRVRYPPPRQQSDIDP